MYDSKSPKTSAATSFDAATGLAACCQHVTDWNVCIAGFVTDWNVQSIRNVTILRELHICAHFGNDSNRVKKFLCCCGSWRVFVVTVGAKIFAAAYETVRYRDSFLRQDSGEKPERRLNSRQKVGRLE